MANIHSRGHDLSFTLADGEQIGFDLYWEGKDPPLTVTSEETAEVTATFLKRDLPRVWYDWTGGAFHSLTPQAAGPLIYSSIGQFGTAPPVYAYTKNMRMRDPAVATPAGEVKIPPAWDSATLTGYLGIRGVPKCVFNYNGAEYFVLANGDVLRTIGSVPSLYKVTNLLDANALNVWNEAGSGTKTAAKTTFVGAFDPIKVVQYNGGFYLVQSNPALPILHFDGADENGVASDSHWFKSSATGGVADTAYWVKNNRGADFFVMKSTRGAIKYTNVNPLQAVSHSADYPIGDIDGTGATYAITNLLSTGRVILVAKEDGVYTFDELGHAPNLTPQMKNAIGTDNGAVGLIFGDYAIFQFFEGLYRVSLKRRDIQDLGGWITPGLGLPNRTPINGPVVALSRDRDWLAVVIRSNGRSWLGYGRERTDDDPPVGPMIYHFSEYDYDGTISLLHRGTVATDDDPVRMWMGGETEAGAAFLVCQDLPRASTALAEVESGGPMRFATDYELYIPTDPIGDANALKYVLTSSLQANEVSMPASTFDHQFRFSPTDDWVSLGICGDPSMFAGLPPENQAGGYQVEQRLVGVGPNTNPPSLYALRTRFAIVTEPVGVRRYRLKIGKHARASIGFDRTSLARQWTNVLALTTAGKIRGHDRVLGDRLVCRVEQGVKATPIEWTRDGEIVSFAVEIEVSVYGQGRSGIRYDDGRVSTYDTGSLAS